MKCPLPLAQHLKLCHTTYVGEGSEATKLSQPPHKLSTKLTAHRLTCYTKFTLVHQFTMTDTLTINRSHLVSALYHEYQFLCHDDFDPEVDPTPDEYLLMLQHLSDAELINEASADDLDEFISHWL